MKYARFLALIAAASSCMTLFAANIISTAGGGPPTSRTSMDYFYPVTGYADGRGVFTEQLHCRVFRYGEARQNLPLIVFFIGWGGTIGDGPTEYEDMMNDPFISLVIMPTYNNTDDNTTNWYWGNVWTDSSGKKWSVPWTHNGVIELVNKIKHGVLDSILLGCTVDTNRIYCMGNSIGGTAAAQIGAKHPEIFAAIQSHVGWTRYWAPQGGNTFFGDSRGCLAFAGLTGGVSAPAPAYCLPDTSVNIRGNADQLHLPLTNTLYNAHQYTDLNWYFNKTEDEWNCRNPGFESPFIVHVTGSRDDPENQGDNLIPALDASKRGMLYYRPDAGHAGGGFFIHWNWMRNFRKDRSFLAFTNRSYDDFQIVDGLGTGNGYMNDLRIHGWDPETIIDEAGRYSVTLTGTGIADVTLRNLQNLVHAPGTLYDLNINGNPAGQIVADEFGLVTVPAVANAAVIDLVVRGSTAEPCRHDSTIEIVIRPNPFNPVVTILIAGLVDTRFLNMAIFDISGRLMTALSLRSGKAVWDASNHHSGVYVVKVNAGGRMFTKSIVLVK